MDTPWICAAGRKVYLRVSDGSVRRAIRKAERSKLAIRVDRSEEAMLQFYRLHIQTRKRHGLPPQPLSFFLNIHREIIEPGLGFIVLARAMSRPGRGGRLPSFWERRRFINTALRTIPSLRSCGPIIWSCGTASDFSRKWDARRSILAGHRSITTACGASNWVGAPPRRQSNILEYDATGGKRPAARDNSTGLHNAFFRHLPSSLNRLAGSLIYRHLD